MPGPNGVPYVNPAQLSAYAPPALLGLATYEQQLQACVNATSDADDCMNGRYAMPLLAWPTSITDHCAYIVISRLSSGAIGFAPQAGSDRTITDNYCRAMGGMDSFGRNWSGFFPDIQAQRRHPSVTPSVPSGSDPGHDAPQVISQPRRGWQQVRGGRPVVGGF
jgi:hypothetical protein